MRHNSYVYKIKKNQLNIKYHYNIFQNSIVSNLLVFSFVLCDFFVIWTTIDDKINENQIMAMLIAFVYACILDISVYLVAKNSDHFSDSWEKKENLILIILFILFLVSFLVLRFVTASEMFKGTTGDPYTMKLWDYAIVLILSILPLGTSILSFKIGFISEEERERNYQRQLHLDRIQILERINYLNLCNEELIFSMRIDLKEYDKKLYDNAVSKVETEKRNLKLYTRKLMASKINTADAVTILLQDKKEESKI